MESLPLHLCHFHKFSVIINRSHAFFHSVALAALIYYRAAFLFHEDIPILPWLLIFASELLLSFMWLVNRAYLWRPVSRITFPERLPEDEKLPAIDVIICTADPNKEPTVEVMNTVISAMSLDYPPEKLHVYLSDDAGCSVTLQALREAWGFARWWLPFCRTYNIKTRCPKAYFSALIEDDNDGFPSSEFIEERQKIMEKYHDFKDCVMRIRENGQVGSTGILINQDHSPVIEVIKHDRTTDAVAADHPVMPLLVYVAREKRTSNSHHFKAGALNVLLRVSGIISNSPYILVLDCDMYCNDKSSARQAMCFHLDPDISSTLAFVQFPQKFQNIGKKDIYDSQWRTVFAVWQGMDGLQGPPLSGTGFYIKRKALYGNSPQEDIDLLELKQALGPSNEFIKSLQPNYRPSIINGGESSRVLQLEAQFLASCAYEKHTKWGEEVGFLYHSVLEDYFTGFILHCKGWTSVFCNPSRPQFLGCATTNLDDVLVQSTRWNSGFLDVGFSKFCPLIYGPLRMTIIGSLCNTGLAFFPFYCFPVWCLATIPQLCLFNGIPLYPEVSNSLFIVIVFIFLSSLTKHLEEVLLMGGSIQNWLYEQRMWMIKSVTCYFYGAMNAIMKKIGIKKASFSLTSKVVDEEQVQLYQMGKFDFRTSTMFLAPLVTLIILNMLSLVAGVAKMIISRSFNEMFVQVFMSFFVVAMNYPIIEGMVLRKDNGRIPLSITLLSTVFSVIFLSLGSIVLLY